MRGILRELISKQMCKKLHEKGSFLAIKYIVLFKGSEYTLLDMERELSGNADQCVSPERLPVRKGGCPVSWAGR